MNSILAPVCILATLLFTGSGPVSEPRQQKQQTTVYETVHVYGTGYGLPFNHNPETLIEAYLNLEEPPIGSTVSNPDGSYSLNIVINNVAEVKKNNFLVAPNPFHESTSISFYSHGEKINFNVFNELGQMLLNYNEFIPEGNHSANVSGLGLGTRVFTMTSDKDFRSTKLIQTSNYFNPSVNVSGSSFNSLKSAFSDDLILMYSSPNHTDYVVVEPVQPSMNVDYVLDLIPDTLTTTINTTFINNMFNYLMEGVNSFYENNETGEFLGSGVSNSQGVDVFNVDYLTWSYGSNFLSSLNSIKRTSSIVNHEENIGVVSNQNASYDVFMVQIPSQETANVEGVVVNTNNVPVSDANVDIKKDDTTYAQTTTINGFFQTTMSYLEYVNATNQSEVIRIPDSVYAYVTKENHNPTTTNPELVAPMIDFDTITLEQITQNFSFSITPYAADGAHMSEVLSEAYTLHVKNVTTGETQTVQQSGNNAMSVVVEGSEDDVVQFWHTHTALADLIVIQYANQAWNEDNPAQNRPTRDWVHGQQFDTLTTTLGHIANPVWNESLELYSPRYHLTTSNGTPITFNHDVVPMLADRFGWIFNWKRPDAPGLEVFIFSYNFSTGDPIPQNKLDEMIDMNNNIHQHTVSPLGRERLPTTTYIINSTSQPEFLAAQARNFAYTNMTWRTAGAPTNGVTLNLQYWCIDNSNASYDPVTGLPVIQEELFESKLASIDPPWGGTASYITSYDNGQVSLNLTGITMVSVNTMVDSWTYVMPANTGKSESGKKLENYKSDGISIEERLQDCRTVRR